MAGFPNLDTTSRLSDSLPTTTADMENSSICSANTESR